jgi:hypothetical protein
MAGTGKSDKSGAEESVSASSSPLRGQVRLPQSAKAQPPAPQRLVMPQRKLTVRTGQHLSPAEPMIEQVTLPGSEPKFDKLARDITDMVPV